MYETLIHMNDKLAPSKAYLHFSMGSIDDSRLANCMSCWFPHVVTDSIPFQEQNNTFRRIYIKTGMKLQPAHCQSIRTWWSKKDGRCTIRGHLLLISSAQGKGAVLRCDLCPCDRMYFTHPFLFSFFPILSSFPA